MFSNILPFKRLIKLSEEQNMYIYNNDNRKKTTQSEHLIINKEHKSQLWKYAWVNCYATNTHLQTGCNTTVIDHNILAHYYYFCKNKNIFSIIYM